MPPTPQVRNLACAWSWHAHESSDQDIWARLTRARSSYESESVCEACVLRSP